MLLLTLFFVLMCATVAVLMWSGMELLRDQEDPLADRLEQLQEHAQATVARGSRRRGGGLLNTVLFVISLVPGGDDWLRDTGKELAQGGIRGQQSLAQYALFQICFFAATIGGMYYLVRDSDFTSKLTGIVAALILGWLLPQQVLHRLVKNYRKKLQDALPDTVDLLGIVLSTGLALDQAMMRVSEEMNHIYPALASEFSTVVMQVRAGQERAKAFQQLVTRTGIEDIKSLSAMIVQSEKFGTSLSQALKVYADSLRTTRKLRAESAVAKAGIKMLFPIVIFILPAMFVVVLVPAIISVLSDLRQGFGAR